MGHLPVEGEGARTHEGRVAVLRGRLRALGPEASRIDATVATCVAWTSEVLAEVAVSLGDARDAQVLLGEASAMLASAPDGAAREAPAPAAALLEPLTERELVVLSRLRGGMSLREIGAQLFVSLNTVKSHTRAIYRKLGVSSRDEALRRAAELRLL